MLELEPTGWPTSSPTIVGLQERQLVRVFEVPEPVGPWITVLVYLPRSRFTAELPERVADAVAAAYGAEQRTFESFVGASSLARITVSVRRPTAGAAADLDALERGDRRAVDVVDRPAAGRRSPPSSASDAGRRLFERVGAHASAAYRAAVAPGAGGRRPAPHRRAARRRRRA